MLVSKIFPMHWTSQVCSISSDSSDDLLTTLGVFIYLDSDTMQSVDLGEW